MIGIYKFMVHTVRGLKMSQIFDFSPKKAASPKLLQTAISWCFHNNVIILRVKSKLKMQQNLKYISIRWKKKKNKNHILLYLGHICDCGNFLLKKGKSRPLLQNPKSIKIKSITVFVYEKNVKYLTKHESVHILMLNFLIWNSPETL